MKGLSWCGKQSMISLPRALTAARELPPRGDADGAWGVVAGGVAGLAAGAAAALAAGAAAAGAAAGAGAADSGAGGSISQPIASRPSKPGRPERRDRPARPIWPAGRGRVTTTNGR